VVNAPDDLLLFELLLLTLPFEALSEFGHRCFSRSALLLAETRRERSSGHLGRMPKAPLLLDLSVNHRSGVAPS